jgi:uncharacterized membrane protein
MIDDAAVCPCGQDVVPTPRVRGQVGVLPRQLAGALAYFTFIPAVVFLAVDPYRRDHFVRFHSFQCLGLWLASVLAVAGWKLVVLVLSIVPLVGHLLALLIAFTLGMAFMVIWLVLVVKAAQGEYFKLPVLGNVAERLSGAT